MMYSCSESEWPPKCFVSKTHVDDIDFRCAHTVTAALRDSNCCCLLLKEEKKGM